MALTDSAPANSPARLGCGRNIEDVWATIDEPPDEHEANCPDCTAARSDLADLNAATREMITADAEDPKLRTDPAALEEIIAAARSEIRRGRKIPLRRSPEDQAIGQLAISELSVITLIRRVSDDVGEVEARQCRIHPESTESDATETGSDVTETATTIIVDLVVTVAAGQPIGSLINDLRTKIITAVEAKIGFDVRAVNVTVEDLHDD